MVFNYLLFHPNLLELTLFIRMAGGFSDKSESAGAGAGFGSVLAPFDNGKHRKRRRDRSTQRVETVSVSGAGAKRRAGGHGGRRSRAMSRAPVASTAEQARELASNLTHAVWQCTEETANSGLIFQARRAAEDCGRWG